MNDEAQGRSSEPERSLEVVLAEFLTFLELESREEQEALIVRHPKFAQELRDFRSNHDHVNALARNLREPDPGGPLPRSFGRFILLRQIGKGGMGVVYRAWDSKLERPVALKMIRGGPTSKEDVARFLKEAQAVSDLDHPNIVRIHDYGDIEGQPYFTMNLVEGGGLHDRIPYFKQRPREAARLLATITRAVRHAHQRAILHRDLKPANVLLDRDMTPHVTDFGLALRVDRDSRLTAAGAIIGTLHYMAPEQARGERLLTLRADVYALGAILYELLTGRPPVPSGPPLEMLEKIEKVDPPPPTLVNPKADRDLSTISMKCLEKDPLKRYENAAALADDLENWLEERPIQARPAGRLERAWRWCRRRPGAAALAAVSAVLLVVLGVAVALAEGRRQERLETNVAIARHVAGRFRQRLARWGADVERASRDPNLVDRLESWNRLVRAKLEERTETLLNRNEGKALQEFLKSREEDGVLVNWQLLDRRGIMVARTPTNDIKRRDFRNRDYFVGTRDHARDDSGGRVHVSTVYRSFIDRLFKLGIACPVLDAEGNFAGVVAVSITTGPDLGLEDIQDGRRKAVLVAPTDRSLPYEARLLESVILLHPELGPRDEALQFDRSSFTASFPRRCGRELVPAELPPSKSLESDRYLDPFGKKNPAYEGSWLAGFAPVGQTGMVVVVQQRDE